MTLIEVMVVLAIMVAIARSGGLSESDLISWAFGGYGITGLMSIVFALRYRAPLPMAWTGSTSR